MRQRPALLIGGTLPTLVAAMLAACSPSNDQPGAVSADEAQQLNDAAEMLDANSVDLNVASESPS